MISIFDRRSIRHHRDRAAPLVSGVNDVLRDAAERLLDRLDDTTHRFTQALDVGGRGVVAPLLRARGIGCVSLDLSPRMAAINGGLAVAGLVDEVFEKMPGFPLLRGYEMADSLREEVAFDLFFSLLRGGIAGAVTAHLRGASNEVQARLLGLHGVDWWGAVWSRLGEIQRETEQHNLERRQGVVAGLGLLV